MSELKNKIIIKKKSNSPSIKDILKKLKKPKSKDENDDDDDEEFKQGRESNLILGTN